jgi:hypothetical protein
VSNQPLNALSAELRESDPLCLYGSVQRSHIELMLALSTERSAQLAIACDLLQRTRAELLHVWHDDGNNLQAYQQTALRSIDECLNRSRATVRLYRASAFVVSTNGFQGLVQEGSLPPKRTWPCRSRLSKQSRLNHESDDR